MTRFSQTRPATLLTMGVFLLVFLAGCSSLEAGKTFPKGDRQKFVDKFAYFENNGFGGYYKYSIETEKGDWSGKTVALFLPNVPSEFPDVIKEFHQFPEDWKAQNFSEVDTLILLEFRGGVGEKLLNKQPTDLRLVMTLIDTKKKVILRKIKVETWPPATERRSIQKNLPSIKELLEKKRKK